MEHLLSAIKKSNFKTRTGYVSDVHGLVIESIGPDVFVGELCEIKSHLTQDTILCEVVGIKNKKVQLMPYSDIYGIDFGSEVKATGVVAKVPVSHKLLGRVIDAFGNPLDGKPLDISPHEKSEIYVKPQNPLNKTKIDSILETGVKAIDAMTTLGKGQRLGILAGSGVGKSTLLGMIARNIKSDVNVIALVGERGREVAHFVEDVLGEEGLKRSIVIVATSDQPPLVRRLSAYTAITIAEYFSGEGNDVVLMMDSITRYAMALREIGLSVGEPPTARGYTPSVFAALPSLLERTGPSAGKGSITALYTILVEGDDEDNPVIDCMKSILDGHISLSKDLANKGHYPSIDILRSVSRLLLELTSDAEKELIQKTKMVISLYEDVIDMLNMGAYKPGANKKVDDAISLFPKIESLFQQNEKVSVSRSETMNSLKQILV